MYFFLHIPIYFCAISIYSILFLEPCLWVLISFTTIQSKISLEGKDYW